MLMKCMINVENIKIGLIIKKKQGFVKKKREFYKQIVPNLIIILKDKKCLHNLHI